ncbi:MAG: toxic anion resistance protein [Oscillospiraceae bacterium]|nr:toxic anion resistance protein [Oscillospiraceae bacterium]
MDENIELTVTPQVDTKEIEATLLTEKKVDDTKVEKSLNYEKLTDGEKKAVDEFVTKIDVTNTNLALQYGASVQTKLSKFSDTVLGNVRTKNAGEVGGLLTNLVVQIKDFDSGLEAQDKKGIAGIFGSAKKQLEKLVLKYDKIENNIARIERQLEDHKLDMMKDIAIFDAMYQKNLEYFKEISLYIIAGDKKIEELKNVTLPELKKVAEESGDQADIQAVSDMTNVISRFEKKIYDLKTTRIISLQMAPQIRLIQNNDSELIEKIQSSLINTIPLWKNQIIISLGITNASKALDAQKQVTEMTNEMLKKNSELLKQGTVKIAKESEKAIVDVETLKKTNTDIIDTIDSVIKIHQNGAEKRAEAEAELQTIEEELKQKLFEIRN